MLDPQEWHANAGDAVGTCGCSLALGPGQYWWVQFPELVEIVVEVDEVDIVDRSFNPSDDNVLIRKARDGLTKSDVVVRIAHHYLRLHHHHHHHRVARHIQHHAMPDE